MSIVPKVYGWLLLGLLATPLQPLLAQSIEPVPVVGGPCEGCEAVFDGLPADLHWQARIGPPGQPGEPLRIDGRVLSPAGEAVAGVIVYAYQTDAEGIYPRGEPPLGPAARRHGQLRGWAISDAQGRYRFDSIRPASYPRTRIPAHVHMHVIEPGRCTWYLDDIHFRDDPLLSSAQREQTGGRGGSGLVTPQRNEDGVWRVTRDIHLGQAVPGYEACAG